MLGRTSAGAVSTQEGLVHVLGSTLDVVAEDDQAFLVLGDTGHHGLGELVKLAHRVGRQLHHDHRRRLHRRTTAIEQRAEGGVGGELGGVGGEAGGVGRGSAQCAGSGAVAVALVHRPGTPYLGLDADGLEAARQLFEDADNVGVSKEDDTAARRQDRRHVVQRFANPVSRMPRIRLTRVSSIARPLARSPVRRGASGMCAYASRQSFRSMSSLGVGSERRSAILRRCGMSDDSSLDCATRPVRLCAHSELA